MRESTILHSGAFCRRSATSLLSGLEAPEISPFVENFHQELWLQTPRSGSHPLSSSGTGLQDELTSYCASRCTGGQTGVHKQF